MIWCSTFLINPLTGASIVGWVLLERYVKPLRGCLICLHFLRREDDNGKLVHSANEAVSRVREKDRIFVGWLTSVSCLFSSGDSKRLSARMFPLSASVRCDDGCIAHWGYDCCS